MNNTGTHLVIEEFYRGESADSILGKLKDMFELNHNFINIYNDEDYLSESEDGTVYNSRLEEIFYTNFKEDMELLEIKDLINKIGENLVYSFDDEGYGDFNIVNITKEDKITIAISIQIYCI